MTSQFTKSELFSYIGYLLLLSLVGARNYKYAWSTKYSQTLPRLSELLTSSQYEHIGRFIHLVSPDEEQELSENRLHKILPVYNYLKLQCSKLYQPNRQLSIDERMVKSKARTHFRQYIKNKPTKWGYKFWVVADITGYTIDFDLYEGKSHTSSSNGLSYDVVMKLLQPYVNQGYQLFCDNFYSSPTLFCDIIPLGIVATNTLNTNRRGIPEEIVAMKKHVAKNPRGTGFYFREEESKISYCMWQDTKTVVLVSTGYARHSENTVSRRIKDSVSGNCITANIPCPQYYNKFMGGVDKSDQMISYDKVSRRTVRYWKTIFYHFFWIL